MFCVSLEKSFKQTTTAEGYTNRFIFHAMDEQQTSVKHILRKFLHSKNSMKIISNYKVVSHHNEQCKILSEDGQIEDRVTKSGNHKHTCENSERSLTNSFAISIDGNMYNNKIVSPTAGKDIANVETTIEKNLGNIMEDVHVTSPRMTIPIVTLTDFSQKCAKSRRLI